MPVEFLTAGQRADYGRCTREPTAVEPARCFHLDDADHHHLAGKRGTASRLGFALQLATVRFLGRFPEEEREIPPGVIRFMAWEMGLPFSAGGLGSYGGSASGSGMWRKSPGFMDIGNFIRGLCA